MFRKEVCLMAKQSKTKAPPQEDVHIQEFLDMIAPSIIKFNTDHFICGNTYRCVWALARIPDRPPTNRRSSGISVKRTA